MDTRCVKLVLTATNTKIRDIKSSNLSGNENAHLHTEGIHFAVLSTPLGGIFRIDYTLLVECAQ